MKVQSYESEYNLPKEQQDILKKMVHDKTGVAQEKVVISTTGKIQAVINDSERWLMVEAALLKGEQYKAGRGHYGQECITDLKNQNNWIAKAFVFLKLKGSDTVYDPSKISNSVLGNSNSDSRDLEGFLQDISYQAQRVFNYDNDVEIEIKGSALPSSHVILFLLVWRKSMVNKYRQYDSKKKKEALL